MHGFCKRPYSLKQLNVSVYPQYAAVSFVLICVIFWNRGFQLRALDITSSEGLEYSVILTIFSLLAVCLLLSLFDPNPLRNNYYLKSLIFLLFIIAIPILLTGCLLYKQPWSYLLRRPFFFGGYLILPYLCLAKLDRHSVIRLFYVLMLAAGTISALMVLAYFSPQLRGLFDDHMVSTRFGNIRIKGNMICYNLPRLLFFLMVSIALHSAKFWARLISFTAAICMAWMFVVVWQIRNLIFYLAVASICTFILRTPRRLERSLFLAAVAIFAAVLVLLAFFLPSGYIVKNISTVITEFQDRDGTVGVRMSGFLYFSKEFLRTHMIGVGISSTTEQVDNPLNRGLLVYGFGVGDLGFLGLFFQFGFPVLIFTPLLFRKLFQDLSPAVQFADPPVNIVADSIFLFLVAELASLPISGVFFAPKSSLFYGLIMYFAHRLNCPDFVSGTKAVVSKNERVAHYVT